MGCEPSSSNMFCVTWKEGLSSVLFLSPEEGRKERPLFLFPCLGCFEDG